jgi:hypothetical protein
MNCAQEDWSKFGMRLYKSNQMYLNCNLLCSGSYSCLLSSLFHFWSLIYTHPCASITSSRSSSNRSNQLINLIILSPLQTICFHFKKKCQCVIVYYYLLCLRLLWTCMNHELPFVYTNIYMCQVNFEALSGDSVLYICCVGTSKPFNLIKAYINDEDQVTLF